MKKRKFKLPIKLLLIVFLLPVVVCFALGYAWKSVRNAQYFRVTEVIIKDPVEIDFSYLKGKNIFSIDLVKESEYALKSFPKCSNIRIVRVLPNRIFVNFLKRSPLALVKLYKYFVLDGQGTLFHDPILIEDGGLPIIVGLETKIFGPKSGRRYNTKEIQLALELLKEFKKNRVLSNYMIKTIDLKDLSKILVSIDNIEVRLAQDEIGRRLDILGNLFAQSRNKLTEIKYIDLRFKAPVIKYIDAK
ncbi:MAG: cell division protein FtsQ/DivIB [Candidatus Omnitrophica bacterium]|nr:cell division protein FtsQ/DivIB [Candidatus Omnitrophota bacterium]